jgi:hypothetical protein
MIISIILGLAFLGLGFWHSLFIFGTYGAILLSLASLLVCFYTYNECPNCGEKTLIPIDSQKAQNIMLINNLVVADIHNSKWDFLYRYDCLKIQPRKICSVCYNTDVGGLQDYCAMKFGLLLIIAGTLSIPLALFHPLYLIINFFFLFFGITFTIFCFMEPDRCPKCRKVALIPVDSKESIQIIHEQKITNINYDVPMPKLYTFHENFGIIWIITSWIILAFLMYKLYGLFINL